MITRLAERYLEEYKKGGPRRAGVYAERMFINNELKALVNKRVKELAHVKGSSK